VSKIIISVDGSERSEDAVAFGGALARQSGAGVVVAHAYPWKHLGYLDSASPRSGPTYEANHRLLDESGELLQRMRLPLDDLPDVETRSLADPSPARALQELGEELQAGLIVVGSSHTGKRGRVFPGSTAERLLHGSSCAVAVVPAGYLTVGRSELTVIGCGWDGSPESDAALAAAEELAEKASASLRVIRAFEPSAYSYPPMMGVGYLRFSEEAREFADRALSERVDHIRSGVMAEGEVHQGSADRALIEVSESVDLMVLGSRGYGPIRAVLLGGVSGRVVRDARCPVIVVPAGSREAIASVFRTSAEDASAAMAALATTA